MMTQLQAGTHMAAHGMSHDVLQPGRHVSNFACRSVHVWRHGNFVIPAADWTAGVRNGSGVWLPGISQLRSIAVIIEGMQACVTAAAKQTAACRLTNHGQLPLLHCVDAATHGFNKTASVCA
jgi:hypothetical protein